MNVVHTLRPPKPPVRIVRQRYTFERAPDRELSSDRNDCHALYDIMDNKEGAGQAIAMGVRHDTAVLIVHALNTYEEVERAIVRWEEPPPAA